MTKSRALLVVGLLGIATFAYGAYIPIKADLAQFLIHRAWNQSIETGQSIKPWAWADMHPVLRLESKAHNQDLIVLSGDTGNVLAFGPGLSSDTPYISDASSLIISAHRDTHFTFLQDVVLGDEILLTNTNNLRQHYKVTNIEIIDTDKQDILLDDNQSIIKLVTCYPFDALVAGGPLRYVVDAQLVI